MATTCSLFEIDDDLNKLVEAYPQFSLLPEIDRTIFRASKGRVSQLSLVLASHRASRRRPCAEESHVKSNQHRLSRAFAWVTAQVRGSAI